MKPSEDDGWNAEGSLQRQEDLIDRTIAGIRAMLGCRDGETVSLTRVACPSAEPQWEVMAELWRYEIDPCPHDSQPPGSGCEFCEASYGNAEVTTYRVCRTEYLTKLLPAVFEAVPTWRKKARAQFVEEFGPHPSTETTTVP